jgi:hypothetical protein
LREVSHQAFQILSSCGQQKLLRDIPKSAESHSLQPHALLQLGEEGLDSIARSSGMETEMLLALVHHSPLGGVVARPLHRAPTYANSAIATANYLIVAPDFSLTPASSELTIQLGGQGTDVITIAPLNAACGNAVQLSCMVTGPLPLPACSLSPTSVTPGTGSPTSILTITTPSVSATLVPSLDPHPTAYLYSAWLSLVFTGLTLFASRKKESGRYASRCCFLVLVLMQAACGGGE